MAFQNLHPVETRILGCLLEKERITPENYPLSLNSLVAACNQTTNREPVVAWDEKTIEHGVSSLREKRLATVVFGAGSRVQKYRHNLLDHYELDRGETAVLCALLLRGPQTPGELRVRTERMHGFSTLNDVEACLEELGRGDNPMVKILPARPGQKERRYAELLSAAQPEAFEATSEANNVREERQPAAPVPPGISDRVDAMEKKIASLQAELAHMREEYAAFRKQFE